MAKDIIVASHRRSGTHLTIDAIINNFQSFHAAPDIPSVTLDQLLSKSKQQITPEQYRRRIASVPAVMKTHAHGHLQDFFEAKHELVKFVQSLFERSKTIYVHRDGRDVMVSLYFYEARLDPVGNPQPFSEFIRGPNRFNTQTYQGAMNRVEYWAFHVRSWLMHDNVLIVSFDDFQNKYALTLQKIADFVEAPLNSEIVDVRRKRGWLDFIDKIRRRFPVWGGSVRLSSVGFRSGRSGDWKYFFSEEDLSYFNSWAGELNQQLGYDSGLFEFP